MRSLFSESHLNNTYFRCGFCISRLILRKAHYMDQTSLPVITNAVVKAVNCIGENDKISSLGQCLSEQYTAAENNDDIPLPQDWVSCTSRKHNRIYYFNKLTGQSLWEKPDYRSPLHRHVKKHSVDTSESNGSRKRPSNGEPMDTSDFAEASSSNTMDKINRSKKRRVTFSDASEEPMEVDQAVNHIRREYKSDLNKRDVVVEENSWLALTSPRSYFVMAYVVVDTNVWVKNLSFLQSIERLRFRTSVAVIVVPYVVLQELDFLKDAARKSQNNQNIGPTAASAAISFIHSLVESKSMHILCQPAQVDSLPQPGFTDIPAWGGTNDDRVLKCLLQIKNLIPDSESTCILCTNDKALLVKTLAHDALAGTCGHVESLLNDMAVSPEKYASLANFSGSSSVLKEQAAVDAAIQQLPATSTFDGLLEYSRSFLCKIVEDEFIRAYGKDAPAIYVIKPPWPTLKVVLEVILKHWVSVYRYVWQESDDFQELFQALYKILAKKHTLNAPDELRVVSAISRIIEPFSSRPHPGCVFTYDRLQKSLKNFYRQYSSKPKGPKKSL